MAQVMSGPTGQFDLTGLDPIEAAVWQLRLPDYAETPLLRLEVDDGLRYLVEFEVQPPAEEDSQPVESP